MKLWQTYVRRTTALSVWRLLEKARHTPAGLMREAAGIGITAGAVRDVLARLEGDVFSFSEGEWRPTMQKTKELKSVDEFIEQAKLLRSNAEEAEARFLIFLREFELDREDLWKTAGVQTFDQFLLSTQLCNSTRYRNFVAGAKLVQGDAESIGAGATVAAGGFRKPTLEATQEFVSRCGKFREVHDVAPSEGTAAAWVKQLDQGEPKVVRQASRLRQLEAENQSLRAENRQLLRKIKDAEKLIDRLQKSQRKAA